MGDRPVTTDDFAKYHHDHVHRSFLDPLTLRAEVEALRKDATARREIDDSWGHDMTAGEEQAYFTVLDLIDKRMEAGQ